VPSLPQAASYEYTSAYETDHSAAIGEGEDDAPDLSKLSDEDRKLLEEVRRIEESGGSTPAPFPAPIGGGNYDYDDGDGYNINGYGGDSAGGDSSEIKPAEEDNFGLGGFGGGISYIQTEPQDLGGDTDFADLTMDGGSEDNAQEIKQTEQEESKPAQNNESADFTDLSEFEIQPGEIIDPFSQALSNYDLMPGERDTRQEQSRQGAGISVASIQPEVMDGDLSLLGMNDFERSLLAKEAAQSVSIAELNPTIVDIGEDLTAVMPNQVEKGEDLSEDAYELFGSMGGDTALKAFEGTKTDELHGNLAALGMFSGGDDDMSTSSDVTALFRR
jgi:hypothetical protein